MTPLARYMADSGCPVCPSCDGCGVRKGDTSQFCRTCGGYGAELELSDFDDEGVIIALEDMSVDYQDVIQDIEFDRLDRLDRLDKFDRYYDDQYDKMKEGL